MPIYGEAKRRDMIRSILPSTRRKGAREDLAHIKRSARTATKQALHNFRGSSTDAIDLYEYGNDDLEHYPDARIKDAVWDRREGDKVRPIMRWAVEITKDLPQEQRMDYFRALMPDTTVGRHACQHVEFMDEMDDGTSPRWRYSRDTSRDHWTDADWRWYRNACIAELAFRLRRVFETPGAHKRFNDSRVAHKRDTYRIPHKKDAEKYGVRQSDVHYSHKTNGWYYYKVVRRPLLGVHDIEDFLREFCTSDGYIWGSWKYEELNNVLEELEV